MKKTKRLVSFVTATAFMLSSVAPAFAADVTASIGRLGSLGVVKGYNAAGTDFKPEQNITRAEFAAVAVRLLGLEAAESAAKGGTKFKDVTASHWGSGYINLAVGNGIIKGYPDGTFKPEANVTYAEAFAMLVRVLGYEPVVKGAWPTNYIGKASQLGLLDGVTLSDYNGAATRGNVFLGADNALEEKVLIEDGYDNQGKVTYKVDTTLMEKRLSVTKKAEGIVNNVPNYGTDKGKVSIDTIDNNVADFTVEVASSVDPNAHFGEKVVVWVKDDKAFYFDVKTNKSDIIYDEADADVTGTKIKLKNKDKEYDFSTDAQNLAKGQVKRNFATVGALTDIKKGDKVKVVLDANGKVNYVEAWKYTPAVVEEVKTSDEKLVFENEGSLDLKNDIYTIVKDGKAIGLADIKAGDVVDYVSNGNNDRDYVIVTSNEASGKLTAAIEDSTDNSKFKLTVGDKTIKTVARTAMRYSTDKGSSWKAVDDVNSFKSLLGKDVKVKLNQEGKAVYVIADSEASSSEVAVWVKDVVRDSSVVNEKTYIKVGKFDGTNTMYEVTKDADFNDKDVIEDDLKLLGAGAKISNNKPETLDNTVIAKIALTADGKVDYVKTYASTEFVEDTNGVTVDKDNKTISTDAGVLKITDDTKFIYKDGAADTDDVKSISWDAFKSLAFGANNIIGDGAATPALVPIQVVYKDGKAKYVAIDKQVSATTDYKYGLINAKGTDSKGSFVEFNQKGTINKYEGSTSLAKEAIVRFKLKSDGKLDGTTVTTLTYSTQTVGGAAYDIFVVKSVNKTDKLIEIAGYSNGNETSATKWVLYSSDVEVYDLTKTNLAYKSIDDLTKGDKIRIYDPVDKDKKDQGASADGVFDFIVRDNDL